MNNKSAKYDDILEVIKEQVYKFELKRQCIIDVHEALISKTESEIISFDQSINDFIREQSFTANRNQYYPRNYASKNTMELVDAILFQEHKQPKENHPHGWYRKFEKKRF